MLGLSLIRRDGDEWAEFDAGPVRLALHGVEGRVHGRAPPSSGSTIWTAPASRCVTGGTHRRPRGGGRRVRTLRHGARPRRQPGAADRVRAVTAETCPRCGQPLPRDANFCPNCGAPVAVPVVSERRVVTVVFGGPRRFDRAGGGLDPERFRDVLAAFHGMVTDEITVLGGRRRASSATPCSGSSAFRCCTTTTPNAQAGLAIVARSERIGARLGLPVPWGSGSA